MNAKFNPNPPPLVKAHTTLSPGPHPYSIGPTWPGQLSPICLTAVTSVQVNQTLLTAVHLQEKGHSGLGSAQ